MKLIAINFTRPDGTTGYDVSFTMGTALKCKALLESFGYSCEEPEEYEPENVSESKPKRIRWDKSEIRGLGDNIKAVALLEGFDFYIQSIQRNLSNQLSDFRKAAQKVGATSIRVRPIGAVIAEKAERRLVGSHGTIGERID